LRAKGTDINDVMMQSVFSKEVMEVKADIRIVEDETEEDEEDTEADRRLSEEELLREFGM